MRLAVATAVTMGPARCCHRRCRGAAASRDRQQAAEGTREPANWSEGAARTPTVCLPALASPRSIRALLPYEVEFFLVTGVFVCVGVRQSYVRPAIGVLVADTVSSQSPCESEEGPAAVRVKEMLPRRHSPGRSNFRRKPPPSIPSLTPVYSACVCALVFATSF